MRYSLFSRFQGVFFGSVLGEYLGLNCLGKPPEILGRSISHFPHRFTFTSQLAPDPGWHDFATSSLERLLQSVHWQTDPQFSILPENHDSAQTRLEIASRGQKYFPTALGAIAPVACFYHENRILLEQHITSLAHTYHFPPEVTLSARVLGELLGLILREQLEPLSVLPNVIEQLTRSENADSGETQPVLLQLSQVQTLIEQGTTLEASLYQLISGPTDSLPMALACYCFLSTPEDWRLVVLRAARSGKVPPLTCAIAGALAGAYNSVGGIPVSWRLKLRDLSSHPEALPKSHSSELFQLSHHLLAAWSGIYDLSAIASEPLSESAIAAPQILRPR